MPTVDGHLTHKNWSPFLYNGSVMFIQSINPFHVVSLRREVALNSAPTTPGVAYADTVSLEPKHPKMTWNYGHFHGGTPALYREECDCFLSFMHSKGFLPGNALSTYFAGAFTFSKSPPFRLLSVSRYPIMDQNLYTGPWVPYRNRFIDYVVFPMCYELREQLLYMSVGHQDCEGWLTILNITDVLSTLYPLE